MQISSSPVHRVRENPLRADRAFTLIELVVVIAILAIVIAVAGLRFGAFDVWKEENTLRQLSETLVFLNQQAVIDQEFYRIEFDLENGLYRVGVMRSDNAVQDVSLITGGGGYLSDELAAFLSPSLDYETTMIPPPSFPSLAEPVKLPGGMRFVDVRTPRGMLRADQKTDEIPYLMFSPRGFSEFGVIHAVMGDERPVTVFVNPWTGIAEVFREYKDFEWTLGNRKP
jgi:prepilin-type N-terminal cleavage/methylation domain-containing protein